MADVTKNVIALFDELITQGERIKESCRKLYFAGGKKSIDAQGFEAWRTSCLTLLRSTFGKSSPHCDSFLNLKFFDHYNSTILYLGILQGAREDIRRGYFYHKDLMLSVNVLSAFLDLAERFDALDAAITDGEAIQNIVYDVGKAHAFEPLRDWFKGLYEVLLGQEQGPRFGSFAAIFGVRQTAALLRKGAAGELLAA